METRTRDLVDWVLKTPALLQEFVSQSGLTDGYVTSELRRYRKFLDGQTISGRLALSYRVARELIKLNDAMFARYSPEPSQDGDVDGQQASKFIVEEHFTPSQWEVLPEMNLDGYPTIVVPDAKDIHSHVECPRCGFDFDV